MIWRIEWTRAAKLSDRDREVTSRAYDDQQSAICQIPYRLGVATMATWTGACYEVKRCDDGAVVAYVIESNSLTVDSEPDIPRGTELVAASRNGRSTRWIVTGCHRTWVGVKKSTWWRRLYWRLRRYLRMA